MKNEPRQDPPACLPLAAGPAYSFDVELAPDGKRAVVITEVHQVGDRCERHRMVVDESELAGFLRGLKAVVCKLGTTTGFDRAYSVVEVRSRHPQAYAPWSPADDQRLLARHRQGVGVVELAREFGRKENAIRSRLARLGVGAPHHTASAGLAGSAGKQAAPRTSTVSDG